MDAKGLASCHSTKHLRGPCRSPTLHPTSSSPATENHLPSEHGSSYWLLWSCFTCLHTLSIPPTPPSLPSLCLGCFSTTSVPIPSQQSRHSCLRPTLAWLWDDLCPLLPPLLAWEQSWPTFGSVLLEQRCSIPELLRNHRLREVQEVVQGHTAH